MDDAGIVCLNRDWCMFGNCVQVGCPSWGSVVILIIMVCGLVVVLVAESALFLGSG
jgi:hypothetical protein